jgi:hypothetical protein
MASAHIRTNTVKWSRSEVNRRPCEFSAERNDITHAAYRRNWFLFLFLLCSLISRAIFEMPIKGKYKGTAQKNTERERESHEKLHLFSSLLLAFTHTAKEKKAFDVEEQRERERKIKLKVYNINHDSCMNVLWSAVERWMQGLASDSITNMGPSSNLISLTRLHL